MNDRDKSKCHETLATEGWAIVDGGIDDLLPTLGAEAFASDGAGVRCLLDQPVVREAAVRMRERLVEAGWLPPGAVAIQAIAFDKNPAANWKVTWHQDVMFPLAKAATAPGYELMSCKEGVHYARPPREVLERLVAVRLHVDDCDNDNGPLRVAPGSHRAGVFRSAVIPERVAERSENTCLAAAGEAVLMKPLLLHASSPARVARRRRVLHVVYHDGTPVNEAWHRSV